MAFGKEFFTKIFETQEISEAEKEIRGNELEQVIEDTPVEDDVQPVVTPDDKPEDVTPEPEKKEDETPVVEKYVIDGEEFTIEELREMKKGNMRQSDYTKKTQELADQRKEVETLRKNLESSPEAESVAMKDKLYKLEYELANKELDMELADLKAKYPDFDEAKVLTEANKRGMTTDFEFVYKALRDNQSVDIEQIKKQAVDAYKEQVSKELAKNSEATKGSIISSEPGSVPTNYEDMVSSSEKAYCVKRGIDIKAYVEMRDAEYKI